MPIRENPRSWLAPAGALFGAAGRDRAALYARGVFGQERLRGPVISVGNLSVGGRGKTPVVSLIAEILLAEGLPVSILSRGYRGAFDGEALLVSDGQTLLADAALAGDEPVMLAGTLPGAVVAVGRRRISAGRLVEARFGPRVHVLDDGFQHLALARDLDVLCLEASDLRAQPLPAGHLREYPHAAKRADVVLVSDAHPELPEVARVENVLGRGRVLGMSRRPLGFFTEGGVALPLPPKRVLLLAGVAGPERFVRDVSARGVEIADVSAFPDHHPFTAAELAEVASHAAAVGAEAVVTTLKDVVRIPRWPHAVPLLTFRVRVVVSDPAAFRERVLAVGRRLAAV